MKPIVQKLRAYDTMHVGTAVKSTMEDGGGPWGEETHEHETAEQAQACERCDEYMAQVTGFPSRKQRAIDTEASERAELKRLLEKYGPDHTSGDKV